MSDLISREAVLNATKMVYIECLYMDEKDYEECVADDLGVVFTSDIKKIPAVDAVEVVRCKDCKYNGDDEECPILSMFAYTSHDGFCCFGERKDNATD